MRKRITNIMLSITLNMVLSITLSSPSFNLLAKEGSACNFAEEMVLVQIKPTRQDGNEYTLSTLGNKYPPNTAPSASERLFYASAKLIDASLPKSTYFLATINHATSGACPPQQVVHIEKFTVGTLQLQIDEQFYYGGMFRLLEAQNCLENTGLECKTLSQPEYNAAEIKMMRDISARTLKACSLNAIRINNDKLKTLSSTEYILGCALNKGSNEESNKEEVLYFEMINERLEFRGVLF